MKITVNFKLLNKEFDQDLADNFFEGQEADGNVKYLWEDEMNFKGEPVDFKIVNHETFALSGLYPDGNSFKFDIWNVTILRAIYKDGSVSELAVSKKLVKDLKRTNDGKNHFINVILKDGMPYINPMDGIYILKKEFPEELINYGKEPK